MPALHAGWYLNAAQEREQITSGGSKFITYTLLGTYMALCCEGTSSICFPMEFCKQNLFQVTLGRVVVPALHRGIDPKAAPVL